MIGVTRVVKIEGESDIVAARQAGKDMARELGFGAVDQIRVATSISELTRNVVRYAGAGSVRLSVVESSTGRMGLEIVCEDNGPGIANIEEVLEGAYTSTQGLGLGLSGTKRLMDEFQVVSEIGSGTTVTIRKWL